MVAAEGDEVEGVGLLESFEAEGHDGRDHGELWRAPLIAIRLR